MRYVIFLTLLIRLSILCNAFPQFPAENDEGSVDSANDRLPDSIPPAVDRLSIFPTNSERAELTPKLQASNASDVFADRAEVVAVYMSLTDKINPQEVYATQGFSFIIDEYKGERPVRRSDCETMFQGVYEKKKVETNMFDCVRIFHLEPLPDNAESYSNLVSGVWAQYPDEKPFRLNLSLSRIPNFVFDFSLQSNGVTSNPITLHAPNWSFRFDSTGKYLIDGLWRLTSGGVAVEPYKTMGELEYVYDDPEYDDD